MAVLSLEELSQLPFAKLDQFGEKSKGSWLLNEILRRTGRDEDNMPLFIQDKKYHLSDSEPINSTETLDAVMDMANTPVVAHNGEVLFFAGEPKILLARSSAKVEYCGEYHSGFFYADPSNPELTQQGWLREAQKVRESGAGPMIIDALYGQKIDLAQELEMDERNVETHNAEKEKIFRPLLNTGVKYVIGPRDFSFVGKTSSGLGSLNSVTMAVGLATKIVRGDEDVTTMFKNSEQGIQHFDPGTLYDGEIVMNHILPDERVDVVTLTPDSKHFTFPQGMFTSPPAHGTEFGIIPIPRHSNIRFYELILSAAKKYITGKEVEIEGAWNRYDSIPHVFQLRTYDVPKGDIVELSRPSCDKQIIGERQSVMSGRYEGHLVVANEQFRESDLSFRQNVVKHSYFLMPENKEFAKAIDMTQYPNCEGVVFPFFKPPGGGHQNIHAHCVGLALQLITRVDVDAMSLSVDPNKVRSKSVVDQNYTNHREILNTIIESDGVNGQIYKSV